MTTKIIHIIRPILLAILFIVLVMFGPLIINFGKTGRQTTVLGKDYSLLSKSQIIAKLAVDFPNPTNFSFTSAGRQFDLPLSSVSASINYSTTASNLLFRRLNQGLPQYFRSFFEPRNFNLEIDYRPELLTSQIDAIASQINRPYIPTELVLNPQTKNIEVKAGQLGSQLDQSALSRQLISNLTNYHLQPFEITIETKGTLPNQSQIDQTILKAQKLIDKKIILKLPDQEITLTDQTLINWLDFDQNCRTDNISFYVDSVATSIKKDPIDAVFQFENGKVLEFKPATKGYSLNSIELKNQLCPSVNQIIASSSNQTIETPLNYTDPTTQNSMVNDLGIKELLGRGASTFKHSSTIRNHNVEKGASIVNRVLVAPGETFSFLKNLGEVSLETGFKKAYVIRAGKTELDVGGGICQVSTTLFRAMLNAGLNITERKNHAYRVGYYEEDMPPGYDATVFIPSPDLKFINDTGHHLLIQSTYDGVNKKLTYDIYGTSDGRKTEITNYRQWGAAPPPPAVYIDDPTLAPGKVVQDEHAIAGLKTSFDWKVTRDSQIIHQKTFTSNFVPWAAVYRRGP
ncbi:MAG TPA: VanW family protein, partial [Candidatus Woesebacteria bacterium]|nr:VanW family protein [Candidatus Woesebacteria bacterium]